MSGQITTNATVLQMLVSRLQAPVDFATRERAAKHVLDWLSCSILGLKQPSLAGFILSTAFSATGACRVVNHAGNGDADVDVDRDGHADWWNALQINAACGNVLEMDDLDRASILHPGPVIIPAAIAVAEMVGASGAQLCEAIVRGYEATIRIGRAMGTAHYTFFHNTSTCGTFGAAAAAADLLGLDAAQTAHALANAGSRTGGLWQMRHEACETKSLHNVMAAQTGVQAARLAQRGVRGPLMLLEGPHGLFSAMAATANPQNVCVDMAAPWRIHEVSFKPWPACRHTHPAIDAALAVRDKIVDVSRIQNINLSTYRSAIDFCDHVHPETVMQAKFSLQHCVAVSLMEGAPSFMHFDLTNLTRADWAAMRAKVTVQEDAALTNAFPNHYGAHITVTLDDGTQVSYLQRDAKGDPELPLSVSDLMIKATTLMTEAGIKDCAGLISATLNINNVKNIRDWTQTWPKIQ